MTILSDDEIRWRATSQKMITPFVEKLEQERIISYGLSSYGYDARLAPEYKIFSNLNSTIIDPLQPPADYFVERDGDSCVIPPNSYILGRTVERFCIPRDVLAVCLGKSTYARWGIIVNVTPLEPEWEGYVTLEISNATPSPVKVYANMGICQIVFHKAEDGLLQKARSICQISYADRKGKYQGQSGITLGKVSDANPA